MVTPYRAGARSQGAPPRGPISLHCRVPGRTWVRPVHLVVLHLAVDTSWHLIEEVGLGRRRGCRRRRTLLIDRGYVRLAVEGSVRPLLLLQGLMTRHPRGLCEIQPTASSNE